VPVDLELFFLFLFLLLFFFFSLLVWKLAVSGDQFGSVGSLAEARGRKPFNQLLFVYRSTSFSQ